MSGEQVFDIHLSRLPLILFLCAGLFFFLAGIDIGFFHEIFPEFQPAPGSKLPLYLFLLFFIGFGGIIAGQMLLYLVSPPVIFRASKEGLSFATGFRYSLYTVPWRLVESIGFGVDTARLIANREILAGLKIQFAQDGSLPAGLATPVGVSFAFYSLTLNWAYMDTPAGKAKNIIEEMRKKYK